MELVSLRRVVVGMSVTGGWPPQGSTCSPEISPSNATTPPWMCNLVRALCVHLARLITSHTSSYNLYHNFYYHLYGPASQSRFIDNSVARFCRFPQASSSVEGWTENLKRRMVRPTACMPLRARAPGY